MRSGGQLLVDQLIKQGVKDAFCVPGESYLAVLDALYLKRGQISLYVARQDGGAAFMAEAYGKATGKLVFVLLLVVQGQLMHQLVFILQCRILHL